MPKLRPVYVIDEDLPAFDAGVENLTNLTGVNYSASIRHMVTAAKALHPEEISNYLAGQARKNEKFVYLVVPVPVKD
jgi:hypothetical protein